jgi:hypothetical protein
MAIHFDIRHLVKTSFAPNRLKNTRVKGWDTILLEMQYWWSIEEETILETSFYEPVGKLKGKISKL